MFFLLCSWCSLAQEIKVAYPETVVANQQFTIEYSVEGAKVIGHSISGNPSELKVINPKSPSISTQIASAYRNGRATQAKTTTFSYTAQPVINNGKAELPVFTVQVNGKTIRSATRSISVVPPSALQNRERFIASLELSSNTIFEGETIIAELKLYLSEEANKVETEGVPNISGLFIERLDQDGYEQGQSLFNGKLYNHAILARYEITGDSAKTYTIPSIEVKAIKRVVEKSTGFYRTTKDIPTSVSSTPKTLKVLPLSGEKSPNYLGVFEELQLNTTFPKSTQNSDALELTLKLSGTGSFNTIYTPTLRSLKKHYDLFQPAVKEAFSQTEQGQTGSVSYTYTLVPKTSGSVISDSIALQYFNSTTEQFEYITIPPFTVNVAKEDAETSVDLSTEENTDFSPYPISDTAYGKPWFTLSRFYWILLGIGFGVALFALQRLIKEKRKARKTEVPQLTPAQEFDLSVANIKADLMNADFSGDLLQAIENYVVGSYSVERSNFSKDGLAEVLPTAEAKDLKALLTELELGEYAGVAARRLRSEAGRKELLETSESLIKRLEIS